jgi:hypothetical protein
MHCLPRVPISDCGPGIGFGTKGRHCPERGYPAGLLLEIQLFLILWKAGTRKLGASAGSARNVVFREQRRS